MTNDRVFLDASFVIALLNCRDQLHARALLLVPRLEQAAEVWTTEAVLVEIGNALSATDRAAAAALIAQCYQTPTNVRVVMIDAALFQQALQLYASRHDKEWGLTDCISFVVMKAQNLVEAATADHHFRQAGFQPLLG